MCNLKKNVLDTYNLDIEHDILLYMLQQIYINLVYSDFTFLRRPCK